MSGRMPEENLEEVRAALRRAEAELAHLVLIIEEHRRGPVARLRDGWQQLRGVARCGRRRAAKAVDAFKTRLRRWVRVRGKNAKARLRRAGGAGPGARRFDSP